jgi:hypothetical protein
MSEPLWVDCPSAADIPPPERLRAWATDERHVVLRFPPQNLTAPKASLVESPAAALPFREVRIDPAWLAWGEGLVVRLARAAYEERQMPGGTLENARLAVLADALEEAGCDDEEVLRHLRRQGGVHVRGCWVVDLLLGKA